MAIKYCPILFQDGFQKACVKEECAWYDEGSEKCATLLMGEKARVDLESDSK